MAFRTCISIGALTLPLLFVAGTAAAGSPGLDALDDFRSGETEAPSVQNRFFTKTERFELGANMGYVPNNPFANRYVGSISAGYHFSDQVGVSFTGSYANDSGVNDLKGLLGALVQIANSGQGSNDFQQPLDKFLFGGTLAAVWTPFYGKINLVGESVVNFDFYGLLGAGVLIKRNYTAKYSPNATNNLRVALEKRGDESKIGPTIGLGANFFLNQSVGFKIDVRSSIYIDDKPNYSAAVNSVQESRLYNNFVLSGGLSVFFPKMPARTENF